MNVLKLPFNEYIGLAESTDSEYMLMLQNDEKYLNHLNTVHASALFALAEATSGLFLLEEFKDLTDIMPVVRKVETKYKKPAQGKVFSKAFFLNTDKEKVTEELNTKRRTLLTVQVLLFDISGNIVMQSDFEWFIAKTDKILRKP